MESKPVEHSTLGDDLAEPPFLLANGPDEMQQSKHFHAAHAPHEMRMLVLSAGVIRHGVNPTKLTQLPMDEKPPAPHTAISARNGNFEPKANFGIGSAADADADADDDDDADPVTAIGRPIASKCAYLCPSNKNL